MPERMSQNVFLLLRLGAAEVGALLCALDEMYGPRAGRGLALRAGRAG